MKLSFMASQSPAAQSALKEALKNYKNIDPSDADTIVALGGDGFMLEVLHKTAHLDIPVYGLNKGTVGFLMNTGEIEAIEHKVLMSEEQIIKPLSITITDKNGNKTTTLAINEVSLLRKSSQAANISISVNGQQQMDNLMCDGVLLSTPAGSTAYNASAGGPILPLNGNVLALSPIAAFRPRRWRGAVLPATADVTFTVLDPEKRPIIVSADSFSIENAVTVRATLSTTQIHRLLFDKGRGLENRILAEQFT